MNIWLLSGGLLLAGLAVDRGPSGNNPPRQADAAPSPIQPHDGGGPDPVAVLMSPTATVPARTAAVGALATRRHVLEVARAPLRDLLQQADPELRLAAAWALLSASSDKDAAVAVLRAAATVAFRERAWMVLHECKGHLNGALTGNQLAELWQATPPLDRMATAQAADVFASFSDANHTQAMLDIYRTGKDAPRVALAGAVLARWASAPSGRQDPLYFLRMLIGPEVAAAVGDAPRDRIDPVARLHWASEEFGVVGHLAAAFTHALMSKGPAVRVEAVELFARAEQRLPGLLNKMSEWSSTERVTIMRPTPLTAAVVALLDDAAVEPFTRAQLLMLLPAMSPEAGPPSTLRVLVAVERRLGQKVDVYAEFRLGWKETVLFRALRIQDRFDHASRFIRMSAVALPYSPPQPTDDAVTGPCARYVLWVLRGPSQLANRPSRNDESAVGRPNQLGQLDVHQQPLRAGKLFDEDDIMRRGWNAMVVMVDEIMPLSGGGVGRLVDAPPLPLLPQ